jgi:hypothetical protein
MMSLLLIGSRGTIAGGRMKDIHVFTKNRIPFDTKGSIKNLDAEPARDICRITAFLKPAVF